MEGGGGGYIFLIKTFVFQLLIKQNLKVVHKMIIQGYKNVDGVHVFFKKCGSK